MKNAKKFLFITAVVLMMGLFLSGCSITGGNIGHGINTEVQLNQANFEVVKTVTGSASARYILGLNFSRQDLHGRARRNMVNNANLQGSQALINVTTDIRRSWLIIFTRETVFVSAEVVEFTR